jgi:hypothetical protein
MTPRLWLRLERMMEERAVTPVIVGVLGESVPFYRDPVTDARGAPAKTSGSGILYSPF